MDDGCFTRIHNDVLSLFALMPFTARELRILLHVVRLTWGYQRKTARTTAYDVAAATSMTAQHARAAIASLVSARVLKVTGDMAHRNPIVIGLNKYAQDWRGAYLLPPAGERFAYQFSNPISHRSSDQPRNRSGDASVEKSPRKPARQAASGVPKEKKETKDTKSSPNGDGGAVAELQPSVRASTAQGIPAASPEPGLRPASEDAPDALPEHRAPRPGFDMAVKAFLNVYDRGGAVLPPYKLRELGDAIDAVGLTPAEFAAHVQATVGEKKRGGIKLRVASPSYFVPIIQARRGAAPTDKTDGNPYDTYA